MALRFFLIACLCFAEVLCFDRKDEKPAIDGEQLKGFEIADEYITNVQKDSGTPFVLQHFMVTFEGGCEYWFIPKPEPGQEVTPFMKSKYGPAFEIKVDRKAWRVVSAVKD